MANAEQNFQGLLEPKMRKIFFESYTERQEEFSQVFHVADSKKAKETDQHVAGLGEWEIKDSQGPIKYENINPGDQVEYIHEEYAKGISIERKFVDDELYGVIDKLPKSLGRGGRVIVETVSAQVFNDAFTVNGYDGVSLFSDAHPLRGNKGGTVDNRMTTALSDAGIKEMHLMMKRQVDEAGIKIQAHLDTIIVPDDMEMQLLVLLGTDKIVGSNNNDKSVIAGKYKPVVLSYLTDPNNWFGLDTSLHDLQFFWRVKPEFAGEENFDTMVAKYRGYLRFSVGYSNWRGTVGSIV